MRVYTPDEALEGDTLVSDAGTEFEVLALLDDGRIRARLLLDPSRRATCPVGTLVTIDKEIGRVVPDGV